MKISEKACYFAMGAHAAVDQRRKYTNRPYFDDHCRAVAGIVYSVEHDDEMLAAAYLHDVVEDTFVTLATIRREFGDVIAEMVRLLTDPASDAPRRLRKERDRARLQMASGRVQTIKVADLINNTESIVTHDPEFAKLYIEEKAALLEVLTSADPILLRRAHEQIVQSRAQLQAGDALDA